MPVVVVCPQCHQYRVTNTRAYMFCFRCGKKTHIKHLRIVYRGFTAMECQLWIEKATKGDPGFIVYEKNGGKS